MYLKLMHLLPKSSNLETTSVHQIAIKHKICDQLNYFSIWKKFKNLGILREHVVCLPVTEAVLRAFYTFTGIKDY